MAKYVIRSEDVQQVRSRVGMKGEIETVSFDFSPWTDDNGAITSATWSVKYGNATVSGQALASNVASAQVTTADSGESLIAIDAAGATNSKVIHFKILAKDPANRAPNGSDFWRVW